MIRIMEAHAKVESAEFRPTSARLEAIAQLGDELLTKATDEALGDFREEWKYLQETPFASSSRKTN